jgi:BASS family bile acid:Na+ symporter
MRAFIFRNATSLVILASIALGFVFPEAGLLWKSYIALLLVFLMFFSSLRIEANDIRQSLRNVSSITFGLFMIFVFMPLLGMTGRVFFSPIIVAGIVLAFSAPSAIATAFWARIFKGDIAFAIIISALASIISIVTIPATMLLTTGTMVAVDPYSMSTTLIELILLPIAAALFLKRFIRANWEKTTKYASRVELAILVLLIWGSIAPGTQNAESNPSQFLLLNIFMFIILAAGFGTAYFIGSKINRTCAVTIGIATCVKNAALALVLGLTMFGTAILTPLIANLVAQNLLIVFLQTLYRK